MATFFEYMPFLINHVPPITFLLQKDINFQKNAKSSSTIIPLDKKCFSDINHLAL